MQKKFQKFLSYEMPFYFQFQEISFTNFLFTLFLQSNDHKKELLKAMQLDSHKNFPQCHEDSHGMF